MTTDNKPLLALDMYVLAQDVKTGVYRVCDELFPRLAQGGRFEPRYVYREGDQDRGGAYVASKGMPGRAHLAVDEPSADADIFLSPFGVAPRRWLADDKVLQAHIIYDLIAIHRPDFFSVEAANEVRAIIANLREDTVIFAISEHTKKDLLAYRPELSPGQIAVIPLAAGHWFRPCESEAEKAEVRAKYGIPPEVPYVLSLATLEIRKNLDQVVNAFLLHLEQNEGSPMHLVLAGMSGWKLEKLNAALAAAAKWRHRIILTGFVEDADLSALYSDAVCFVYLSRYEGFGLPPLEAMACGTPVIASASSSLPEVVGDAGIMLDPDDLGGVAKAIGELASSPATRRRHIQAGLKRARMFTWDRCAQIVADTLLAAHAFHVQRLLHRVEPPRLLSVPDASTEGDNTSSTERDPFGYRTGDIGPRCAVDDSQAGRARANGWPRWADRLPLPATPQRVEGGLRMQGRHKSGTVEQPLVSYLTIVRNNTTTLARTIESVQQQTYGNVEHIVLDGASTDGTLALIRQYEDRLDYFASEADAGLYDAINKIVPLARGQLICILNSDDWLEPHAAEIAVHRMRDREAASLLLTTALVRSGDDIYEWQPALVHPGSYFTCANDCHNAIYATRAVYERSGPYDISYKIAADFKWIMTCLDAGATFIYSKEPTVNYSLGGTSGDVRQHSIECMRVVAQRFKMLSSVEVSGLYHSFFTLAGPAAAQQEHRPASHTDFLRRVFVEHAADADFQRALAWASMKTLKHPVDAAPQPLYGDTMPFSAPSSKDQATPLVSAHPFLYRIARRGYRLLRK